jgi:hypothetical protein
MASEASPTDRASTRWPWLRSAIYGAVVALSPAVFVLETQSCSGEAGAETPPAELTGIELVARWDVEPFDAVWMTALVAFAFLAPFFARIEPRPRVQLAWHVAALVTAAFTAALSVAVIAFAIFATRVLRPAGHLAVVLVMLPVIESFVRLVLAVRELRAGARPAARGDPAPD